MSKTLAEWLDEAPFSLTMSSGFFSFYAHCGMLLALEQHRLLPQRITGASAGALVGGTWAAGVDAAQIAEQLSRLQREDFWDPRPGLGLLRGRRFRRRLAELLPVTTFAQCRVPFAVSVWDMLTLRVRVIDTGPLPEAISASCAVPLLFQPVWISGRPLLDGGIVDRHGLAGMPSGRLLYHHIANLSPWRTANSLAMKVPSRESMTALVIDGLPKVGPFRLDRGASALQLAFEATQTALGMPLASTIRLHARGH